MIYLLGVYHCFQTKEYPEFLAYVRDFCDSHGINSLAEEMNCTALRDAKRNRSTIKMVADERLLPHAYCDPDEKERETLGIAGEYRLKFLQWFYTWTEEEFRSRKTLENQKREIIWLDRLQKIFIDPMLFVCGIDHLILFSALLERSGFSFQIADRTWTMNNCA